ncbi:hypothetical protein NHF46_15710 [Arthrobacter alpinus]|nr:hypothetical protein [Arthrobacter alpinus]
MKRQILQRTLRNFIRRSMLATTRDQHDLPVVVYKHNSLIRRKLGNVDLLLQENKAVSLGARRRTLTASSLTLVRLFRSGIWWFIARRKRATRWA